MVESNEQLNIFHIDMNYVCLKTDFLHVIIRN